MGAAKDDHRFAYSPTEMLIIGSRMAEDYGPEDAIADYMELHPEADEGAVRAEIAIAEASS